MSFILSRPEWVNAKEPNLKALSVKSCACALTNQCKLLPEFVKPSLTEQIADFVQDCGNSIANALELSVLHWTTEMLNFVIIGSRIYICCVKLYISHIYFMLIISISVIFLVPNKTGEFLLWPNLSFVCSRAPWLVMNVKFYTLK